MHEEEEGSHINQQYHSLVANLRQDREKAAIARADKEKIHKYAAQVRRKEQRALKRESQQLQKSVTFCGAEVNRTVTRKNRTEQSQDRVCQGRRKAGSGGSADPPKIWS